MNKWLAAPIVAACTTLALATAQAQDATSAAQGQTGGALSRLLPAARSSGGDADGVRPLGRIADRVTSLSTRLSSLRGATPDRQTGGDDLNGSEDDARPGLVSSLMSGSLAQSSGDSGADDSAQPLPGLESTESGDLDGESSQNPLGKGLQASLSIQADRSREAQSESGDGRSVAVGRSLEVNASLGRSSGGQSESESESEESDSSTAGSGTSGITVDVGLAADSSASREFGTGSVQPAEDESEAEQEFEEGAENAGDEFEEGAENISDEASEAFGGG